MRIGHSYSVLVLMVLLGGIAYALFGVYAHAASITATVKLPVCGDEFVDTNEECDVTNLGGASCVSLRFGGGALTCSKTCEFDTSGCLVVEQPGDRPGGHGGGSLGGAPADVPHTPGPAPQNNLGGEAAAPHARGTSIVAQVSRVSDSITAALSDLSTALSRFAARMQRGESVATTTRDTGVPAVHGARVDESAHSTTPGRTLPHADTTSDATALSEPRVTRVYSALNVATSALSSLVSRLQQMLKHLTGTPSTPVETLAQQPAAVFASEMSLLETPPQQNTRPPGFFTRVTTRLVAGFKHMWGMW